MIKKLHFKKETWLFVVLASMINYSIAQEGHSVARVQIGFGSTVNDSEAAELLGKHPELSPTAAFMWVSGLTGTHRTYEKKSTDVFLEGARSHIQNFLNSALEDNNRRLKIFLDKHTEEEVLEDDALQTEARSLLNLQKQLEGALSAAQLGHSMIYAIEVEGEESALEKIRVEPAVRGFINLDENGNVSNREKALSLKPPAYKAEYRDPKVLTASPSDLHSLLRTAVIDHTKEIQQ